ncbi:Rac/Rho-like_protein [Hexamita inflata]|uniref:Rac/Rho-like protein n=1 Tax=Hexamita inflata TaxID=28002 RepID=A0AA86RIL1_9EUKA|nr:Rac/Rho-like protein [Hexamita inflata]
MKCVIVGDGGVGKTCFLIVLTSNKFPEEYVPMLSDLEFLQIQSNKTSFQFNIWDSCAYGGYDRLRPLSYDNADVFLVCYSIDSQISLCAVTSKWLPEIRQYQPTVPFILVGMKSDLIETNRQLVSLEEADQIAQQHGAFSHVQCSSLNEFNLKLVVHKAVLAAFNGKFSIQQGKGIYKK